MLGRNDYVTLPMCRPDEELIWRTAVRFFSGDLNPHMFTYPTLFPYGIAFLDAVYLLGKWFFWFRGSLDLLKQSIAGNPSDLIFLARGTAALLGTLTILLVYRIGKKLFGKPAGILSAFFLAFAYLHVRDSHFAVTDVPVTFMICLSYVFMVQIYLKGRWKDYLLAGIFTGLALSTKWSAVLLFVPLILAHFLRNRPHGGPFPLWDPKFLVASLMIPLLAIAGTPFAVLSLEEFSGKMTTLAATHRESKGWRDVNLGIGWIYHLKFTLWYGLGWPLFLSFLAGIALAFKKNWKSALLLFGFVFVYYLEAGRRYIVFLRYMTPLVPFACIFAAVSVSELGRFMGRNKTLLLSLCALFIMVPSLYRIYWLDRNLAKQDSRILAGDWINQNIRKDQSLLVMGLVMGDPAIFLPKAPIGDRFLRLYLEWPPEFLKMSLPLQSYPYVRMLPAEYWLKKPFLDRIPFNFMIVDSSPLPVRSTTPDMINDLVERYELIQTFPGVGNHPTMKFDEQDGFYVPIVGAQHIERPGPNIYVFKKRQP
jgi:hypothetical protein